MTDAQKWLVLVGAVAVAVLLYLLGPVLTPFLIGAGLAYLCDPWADRLEAKGLSRTSATILVFSVMIAVLVVVLVVLVPLLQQQLIEVIAKLPEYFDWLQTQALPWIQQTLSLPEFTLDLASIKKALADHWQQVGGVAAGLLGSVTSSGLAIVAWLANVVLIPLVMFYLLRDWDVMIAHISDLIPRRHAPLVKRLARDCDTVLSGFLRGQLSVMLALGAVYTVGLYLVGLDLALLIGVFATIAVLMQYHDVFHLLLVFLVFGIGQTLESFVFTPWLVGDRIGLHPVTVIFAVMAGGQLFGFVGVLLALPVAAVVGVLVRYAHERYLASGLYAGDREP